MYCRTFNSITVKPLDVSNAFTPRKSIMKTKNVSRHCQMSVVVVVNCFGIAKIQALRKPPKLPIHLESLFINRDNNFSKKIKDVRARRA